MNIFYGGEPWNYGRLEVDVVMWKLWTTDDIKWKSRECQEVAVSSREVFKSTRLCRSASSRAKDYFVVFECVFLTFGKLFVV